MDDLGNLFVERSVVEASVGWFSPELDIALFSHANKSVVARSMLVSMSARAFFSTPINLSEKHALRDGLLTWLVQPKEILAGQLVYFGAVVLSPVIRGQIQRQDVKRWRKLLQDDYAGVINQRSEVDAGMLKDSLIRQVKPDRFTLISGRLDAVNDTECLREALFIIGAQELHRFVLDKAPLLADRLTLLIDPDEYSDNWSPLMDSNEIQRLIEPWLKGSSEQKAVVGGS